MLVEDIFPRVREIVADVLMIEEDEIILQSRLIADLGAESIDFLDLIFQLEREYKIKIPRGKLEKDARGDLAEDEFEQNGIITVKGMESLQAYLDEVPSQYFVENLKVAEIPMLFTVETFCKIIINTSVASKAA